MIIFVGIHVCSLNEYLRVPTKYLAPLWCCGRWGYGGGGGWWGGKETDNK